jgi:hypothetical protein
MHFSADRRRFTRALTASALCCGVARHALASGLKRDEQILLYPSTARLEDGRWQARIDAWIHELEHRPGVSRLLAQYLGLDLDQLSPAERTRYRERTQLFRVDSESGRSVQIRFAGDPPIDLPPSDANGRIRAEVAATREADGALRYRVVMPKGDARQFSGHVFAGPATGLGVVSDIDDTIKHTDVRNRRQMLLNTFVRDFVAVPGMAAWMQRCARSEPSVQFHYVSGGPHHLLPPIAQFLQANDFPPGSVHLRTVDIAREIFGDQGGTRTHKRAVIEQLLADFPQRRYLFVGDSGEQDPEIYGELAREHPERIAGILIRDVTGEAEQDPRYADALRGLPRRLWTLFSDPSRLPNHAF